MQNGSVYNNLICKIELLNCLGHKKSNCDFLLTFRQIETAEKVLSPLGFICFSVRFFQSSILSRMFQS